MKQEYWVHLSLATESAAAVTESRLRTRYHCHYFFRLSFILCANTDATVIFSTTPAEIAQVSQRKAVDNRLTIIKHPSYKKTRLQQS